MKIDPISNPPSIENETSDATLVDQASSWASSFFTRASSIWLLLALTVPLFFWRLGSWAFFDPDEGRYSEIPREMLASGDWITPRLNGVLYFEKPPLLYWSVAAFFQTFGLNEWAGRMVPALAALGGVFLVYGLGRRMFGPRAGWLSAVVCSTSILWCVMARQLVIDTLFSTAFFAVLTFWWLGHSDEDKSRANWYFLVSWLALAAAVLSKGPVAALLAAVIIFAYAVICGQLKALRPGRSWLGVIPFLLVTAPWFVMVAERNPDFNHFFWYGQHIGRYLGIGANREHVQPFSYFFKLWPLIFFPWSLFVPGAIFSYGKILWPFPLGSIRTPRYRAVIFCALATLGVTLFFSASTSKLITYVMPAIPPLAILMGAYFDKLMVSGKAAWRRPLWSGIWLLSIVLGILAIAVFAAGPKMLWKTEALKTIWAIALGVALAAWLVAIILSARRRRLLPLFAAIGGGFAIFFGLVLFLIGAAAPNHTVRPLIEYIRPGLVGDGKIVQYDYTQSVGFYTGQRVRVFGSTGELGYGVSQLNPVERKHWFSQEHSALEAVMSQSRPVYCVVADHKRAQELVAKLGHGSREIIWNKRRSIVGNAAAAKATAPVKGGMLGVK